MKEIALIIPPEAANVGRLIASQSLETDELFTLTYLELGTHADAERAANSADGAVVILSDRASSEELGKAIDVFARLEKPILALRVYPDDPVPEEFGESQVNDISQRLVSQFIDSLS